MGDGVRGRWLDSDGRWKPGPPPEGWWQERGGGGRWYPPALAHHPAARRPPGMPRPWDSDGDGDGAADPPGAPADGEDAADADEVVPFPTLEPPWPDGEVPDAGRPDLPALLDGDLDVVWSGSEPDTEADGQGPTPNPCQVPRRHVRSSHRHRLRHSFEPADLSDVELDRLLRGPQPVDHSGQPAKPATGNRSWPACAKIAITLAVLVILLTILTVINVMTSP